MRIYTLCVIVILITVTYFITYHPNETESGEHASTTDAPILQPGQTIKVLSWNVQYLAGKKYTFYYDTPKADGPHTKPDPKEIALALKGVANVILKEDPDIILLQEIDTHSKRTYFEDQIASLMSLLSDSYKAHSETYYWKNSFNPHPKVMGSNGMKLAVISKYRITDATRHKLPAIPQNPLKNLFDYKRAILKVRMPVQGQKDLFILNTHLSAFAQGSDHMLQEVKIVKSHLESLEKNKYPWIIGGDFNLLLPGQYEKLDSHAQYYYQKDAELKELTNSFEHFPTLKEADGPEREKWFTHFSNDPCCAKPDRTIDYLFNASNVTLNPDYKVVQEDVIEVSDHFPLIAQYTLPREPENSKEPLDTDHSLHSSA